MWLSESWHVQLLSPSQAWLYLWLPFILSAAARLGFFQVSVYSFRLWGIWTCCSLCLECSSLLLHVPSFKQAKCHLFCEALLDSSSSYLFYPLYSTCSSDWQQRLVTCTEMLGWYVSFSVSLSPPTSSSHQVLPSLPPYSTFSPWMRLGQASAGESTVR